MKRVFVCSPLRGPDGQPSQENMTLARRLMLAVFEAGHAPFVPHLLYPQVLTESERHLKLAFAANYAYLDVCDEIWVYADDLAGCSKGMRFEVEWVKERNAELLATGLPVSGDPTEILFMPEPFAAIRDQLANDFSQAHGRLGQCSKCRGTNVLNSQGICLPCFSGAQVVEQTCKSDGTPCSFPKCMPCDEVRSGLHPVKRGPA